MDFCLVREFVPENCFWARVSVPQTWCLYTTTNTSSIVRFFRSWGWKKFIYRNSLITNSLGVRILSFHSCLNFFFLISHFSQFSQLWITTYILISYQKVSRPVWTLHSALHRASRRIQWRFRAQEWHISWHSRKINNLPPARRRCARHTARGINQGSNMADPDREVTLRPRKATRS